VDPGRKLQGSDPRSPNLYALPASPAFSIDLRRAGCLAAPVFCAHCADASLTYLQTGRLRL
jgi:hypothetical protein